MSMAKCWMRVIKVELISRITNSLLVFGDDETDNLRITITGTKYPATNKDKGIIKLYNLTYNTLFKIMYGEYYKVRIYAGYRGGNIVKIFDGAVAYISNAIHSAHDWECYINFASDVVANYSQKRINFNLNSSINYWTALDQICRAAGINDAHIDENLKDYVLTETQAGYKSFSTILDSNTFNINGEYMLNTDGVGSVIDITTLKGKRVINIDTSKILIGGGNPRVSSEGLEMQLIPNFDYRVGDILHIDNSILNVSINSADVTSQFPTNYMDTNGLYMIKELNFTLENRGDTFMYNVKARAVDWIKQFINEEAQTNGIAG